MTFFYPGESLVKRSGSTWSIQENAAHLVLPKLTSVPKVTGVDSTENTEPMREAIQNTGTVVMGWNAFAMVKDPDSYAGNYEFQVPIFVLTHEVPSKHPKETDQLRFTFVTGNFPLAGPIFGSTS